MALIEVKNAIKTYQMGDELFYAMNNISFEIEQGDFVAIMGASGSGKSTCMNMLGTLDKPNSGEYYLDGVDVFSIIKFSSVILSAPIYKENVLNVLHSLLFGIILW